MKVIIVALLVCVAIAVEATVDKTQLKEKFKTSLEKCSNDPSVGIDKDALKAYRDSHRTGTKPANIGKLSVCILKEVGWMKADNTMDTTELQQLVNESHDVAKAQKVMDECTADRGNAEDTANKMMECLVDYARVKKDAAAAAASS